MIEIIRRAYRSITTCIVSFFPWSQDLHDTQPRKKKIDYSTKVGFTCGAFDLLHAGHVLMLKEAKEQCDYLIVGLQYNPAVDRPEKNRPVQSFEERSIVLSAIKYVDKVILYETEKDLYAVLKNINPDVRIIGSDWSGKKFTGDDLPIKIYFNCRDHGWSTTALREKIYLKELAKRKQI